ncbi:MAG: hypothetical protein WBW37_12340, partial [Methyloceanibacter sp.]
MEALEAPLFLKSSSISVQRADWSVIVSFMSVPGTKRTFSIGHLTAFDTYLLAMEAKHEVTRES